MIICSESDPSNSATTPPELGYVNWQESQREHPVLGPLFHWLQEDKRPSWEEIAPHRDQVKADVGFEGWLFVSEMGNTSSRCSFLVDRGTKQIERGGNGECTWG